MHVFDYREIIYRTKKILDIGRVNIAFEIKISLYLTAEMMSTVELLEEGLPLARDNTSQLVQISFVAKKIHDAHQCCFLPTYLPVFDNSTDM
jgi:hypothetical protein